VASECLVLRARSRIHGCDQAYRRGRLLDRIWYLAIIQRNPLVCYRGRGFIFDSCAGWRRSRLARIRSATIDETLRPENCEHHSRSDLGGLAFAVFLYHGR